MLGPIGSTIYIQEDPILLSNLKRSNIVMDLDNSETDQKIFVCGSLGCLCLVSAWWCWWCPPTPLFIYLSEKLSPIFSSWKNPFLFPVHLFPREDLFCIIFYLWSHLSQIDKGTNLIVFQIRKISRERSPKKISSGEISTTTFLYIVGDLPNRPGCIFTTVRSDLATEVEFNQNFRSGGEVAKIV